MLAAAALRRSGARLASPVLRCRQSFNASVASKCRPLALTSTVSRSRGYASASEEAKDSAKQTVVRIGQAQLQHHGIVSSY
jgi:hypothetical protein